MNPKKLEEMAEDYYKKSGWVPTENAVMNFEAGVKAALNLPEVKAMREALEFYKEHADCADTCRSRGDGWLTRCSCGFEEKQKIHMQALHLAEEKVR